MTHDGSIRPNWLEPGKGVNAGVSVMIKVYLLTIVDYL